MQFDELIEDADNCIRCLLCFTVCPVIQSSFGKAFPSPNLFVSDALREGEDRLLELDDMVYNCLLCGLCTLVCPRNLETTSAVRLIRKHIAQHIVGRD